METKILNYRIIIEPDVRTGTNEPCYTAVCPTLGIADSGDSIEEAMMNIKKGIEAWVESLIAGGESVPNDAIEGSLVAYTSINVSERIPTLSP